MAGRQPDRLGAGLSPEELAALGDLSRLGRRLDSYTAPTPTPEETDRLVAVLRPLVAARAAGAAAGPAAPAGQAAAHPAAQPVPAATEPSRGLWYWLELTRGQMLLLEPAFWWAAGLVFVLGLGLAALGRGGPTAVILALVFPVIAAGAVAYAFRPAARALWELERAAPIHPLELLYTRMGLLLALNLVTALGLVCLVWAGHPRLILWRLAVVWLGPLFALTGAALYATVRWGPYVGAGAPVAVWSGLVLFGWLSAEPHVTLAEALDRMLLALSHSDGVLAAALVALALGMLLIRQAGRWALGEAAGWNW